MSRPYTSEAPQTREETNQNQFNNSQLQYKREEPYPPIRSNSSLEKSPERFRRSMTPNFDINQNRQSIQENPMNYSRMSYKPNNDSNRYDAYKPDQKTANDSSSGIGLQQKSYDSGSKQQDRFPNETSYKATYNNSYTEGSGKKHSNSINDYKKQNDVKSFNEYKPIRSLEEYQSKDYQGRYDREATTNIGQSFKSRSPSKKQDITDENNQPTTQHRPSYTQSSYAPRNLDEPSSEMRQSTN